MNNNTDTFPFYNTSKNISLTNNNSHLNSRNLISDRT